MNRALKSCALALPLVVLCAGPALADVKTRDKAQVKFEGMLGRMIGMFGGKAAREGTVTTNAVKGDRKAEIGDIAGRIVDLKEEKVYDLDMKKKTYTVTTFEELRRRMREAEEKARKETPAEEREPQPQQQTQEKPQKEVEVDFDMKETGQTKQIAGYTAREIVTTITVREKGKTLEESGGMVMTTNAWMGPVIPALKELQEFELRYAKALTPDAPGITAEQMAAVIAMYPMVKSAMERAQAEGAKAEGTPLATTTVFEAVKSKEQLAQQSEQSGGGGGIGGMLARRMMKKDDKPRAVLFTANTETLEVTQSVAPTDLEIPAGFKEKK